VIFAAQVDVTQLEGSKELFRCTRASVAVAFTIAAQVDEPQPGGTREPSRKRRAVVAAAVTITAQVDEPWPGGSREPSQKRRRASSLDDQDQQKGQERHVNITGIPVQRVWPGEKVITLFLRILAVNFLYKLCTYLQ
jgi:hypothetical protein